MATYVETSLQLKWERRNHLQHHMRRLEAIRKRALPQRELPVVVTRPSRLNQSFSIERENLLLVQRLVSISTRKRAEQQRSFSVSLQKYVKRRKWDQIFAENEKLSQKLGKVSSDLSKRRQELSFHEMEKYKQLTSKARLLEMAERVTRTRFSKPSKPKPDSNCDMVL
jgi:hypothetical protein